MTGAPGQTRRAHGPLVVKLGGAAVEAPSRSARLIEALVALHASLRKAEGGEGEAGVVIVHGGGAAVDRRLERMGLTPRKVGGMRVTPADQIEVVVGELGGVVNKRLVGTLAALGARAVGLSLGDGGLTIVRPLTRLGVDLGLVGEIVGGDPALLRRLLEGGYLPVVSPIAAAPDGQLLNVNADDAASGIARILGARLLVLLTDVPGVLDEQGELLPALDGAEIERLIARGVVRAGMIPKVRAALEAATAAGAPALIASWENPERLGSLADGLFPGTLITPPSAAPLPAPAENQGALA